MLDSYIHTLNYLRDYIVILFFCVLLSPDLAAPGVHILATWSPISPISEVKGDKRAMLYNIQSGTSMACPHATRGGCLHQILSPHMVTCRYQIGPYDYWQFLSKLYNFNACMQTITTNNSL
jgi:hypothetical protein